MITKNWSKMNTLSFKIVSKEHPTVYLDTPTLLSVFSLSLSFRKHCMITPHKLNLFLSYPHSPTSGGLTILGPSATVSSHCTYVCRSGTYILAWGLWPILGITLSSYPTQQVTVFSVRIFLKVKYCYPVMQCHLLRSNWAKFPLV